MTRQGRSFIKELDRSSTIKGQDDLQNITTYGRFNKVSNNYTSFDASPFKKILNPDRMQAVTSQDALLDPYLTIDKYTDPLKRDPGYCELSKRDTQKHDQKSKVITDYKGNLIVKLDHSHGLRNGGIYLQTTHGRDANITNDNCGLHSGKKMSTFNSTAQEIFKTVVNTRSDRKMVQALGHPSID